MGSSPSSFLGSNIASKSSLSMLQSHIDELDKVSEEEFFEIVSGAFFAKKSFILSPARRRNSERNVDSSNSQPTPSKASFSIGNDSLISSLRFF